MKEDVLRDAEGIKYKHPERTCLDCKKYKCFSGMENLTCDFAKYGCRQYESVSWKANNK